MYKISLSIFVALITIIAATAQTPVRLSSWGFLDSPPAPLKTIQTNFGTFYLNYQYPKGKMLKIESNGALTTLITIGGTSITGYKLARMKQNNICAIIAIEAGDSAFFYKTDGTAANTSVAFKYGKNGGSQAHDNDFALHGNKLYVVADYYGAAGKFSGLVEVDLTTKASTVLVNYGTDIYNTDRLYRILSDNQNIYFYTKTNNLYCFSKLDPVLKTPQTIASDMSFWSTTDLMLIDDKPAYWAVKDTNVMMNGSAFITKRMYLKLYNPADNSSRKLMDAGYFQSPPPWYLGKINDKYYFYSSGDFVLTNCTTVQCNGVVGANLFEVTNTGSRLVKSVSVAGNTYTYSGNKREASDKIFVEITTKNEGKELWAATPDNFYMINDHNQGETPKDYGMRIDEAAVCGSKLIIPGSVSLVSAKADNEIFITDGTAGAFTKIDILPTAQSSAKFAANVNNQIFFLATDSIKDSYNIQKTSLFSLDVCSAMAIPLVNENRNFVPRLVGDKIQFENQVSEINIYALNGASVMKNATLINELNVSGLRPGYYIIRVKENQHWQFGRFVKR